MLKKAGYNIRPFFIRIGGIGVVLFAILILPESSTERIVLLNTEISDLAKMNFQYRSKKVLTILTEFIFSSNP